MEQDVEHVYLIGPEASSVAKIGHSGNVQSRFQRIQNSSPTKLQLLWSTPGGEPLEKALHRHFDPIRLHGEWFDFGEDDPVTKVQEALSLIVVDGEPAVEAVSRKSIEARDRQRSRLLPAVTPSSSFKRDPSETVVPGWPKFSSALTYYVEGRAGLNEARCWCGHQMGCHSSIRPHACGGSVPHASGWSDCLCLGYEGPLPVNLSDYDLPGHNWGLWKAT